ncbi:hypothetical protein KSP40_PGU016313 [Platanthera guangdongensis]|uniref:Malate dehydrogenase n=1 Tax=Platanthera guangdongensis TaxID=2320717 RepID=A0ABR2LPC7_9ASPA
MVARGLMLGPDQPVILHMLDIFPEALNGVKMELVDAAFPLLKGMHVLRVLATTDVVEACTGVNIAVMVGGFPRKEGMERKDVMSKNVSIYKAQASALEKHAAPNCKVILFLRRAQHTELMPTQAFELLSGEEVEEPLEVLALEGVPGSQAPTNTYPLPSPYANLPPEPPPTSPSSPTSPSPLDSRWKYNSASPTASTSSSSIYPDVNHATIVTKDGEKQVRELVTDHQWLYGEFITAVQQRGAEIIKARKLSSALSAASSACDHMRDWVLGTSKGTWVSMGVYSDGSYGVPAGLIYSFPVTCEKGGWSIVQESNLLKRFEDFVRFEVSGNAAECGSIWMGGGTPVRDQTPPRRRENKRLSRARGGVCSRPPSAERRKNSLPSRSPPPPVPNSDRVCLVPSRRRPTKQSLKPCCRTWLNFRQQME